MSLRLSHFRGIPLLGQQEAAQLDVDLMTSPGFSLDQLMELAGLSVACAVFEEFNEANRILTVAGPGNNGGDALVAARHLKHFGKDPTVVPVLPSLPEDFGEDFDLIIDGIFGFSFDPSKGVRAPFDSVLSKLCEATTPIVSIDIPSGWHVEQGPSESQSILNMKPAALISLTAPKLSSRFFKGVHYLGGRFVPPFIVEKYSLQDLPKYPGSTQIVKLDWDEEDCEGDTGPKTSL